MNSALLVEQRPVRRRLLISGIVQGVGFRPFVFRLATRLSLGGVVRNTPAGVVVEAEGTVAQLQRLQEEIVSSHPPAARIERVTVEELSPLGENSFAIELSGVSGEVLAGVSPDLAVCRECVNELFDPANRRYLYPFINCTNCGPRFSIVHKIPYDRKNTSMKVFTMCLECRREFHDPYDRRFHAQPNGCPECGPQLWLADSSGRRIAEAGEAVRQACERLARGGIVAVRGIGGFHLAVDAFNDQAVQELRRRKRRSAKPLAVMVGDLEVARRMCRLSLAEEALLEDPASPIVLALAKPDSRLSREIAPGQERIGLMLPYTPFHHLLFAQGLEALVMTSGNVAGEPICTANQEALSRLAGIADCFLLHDREIVTRTDDSVVFHAAGRVRTIRRSRGMAPRPLAVRYDGPQVLGVGAELKNTVCLLAGPQAVVSQHLGDLKNLHAYRFFEETIDHLLRLYQGTPEWVARDLHPDYLSSRWAENSGLPVIAVQHHHAHLAAVLAEHGEQGPAIGVILDGAGLGTDNTVWGGEILVGDLNGFTRAGHIEPMPLPGGDKAVAEPWRTAVGYLACACGQGFPELPWMREYQVDEVAELVRTKTATVSTSSCGRLFDAVAAILGRALAAEYEAQGPMELEALAAAGPLAPFSWALEEQGDTVILLVRPLIREVVEAAVSGMDPEVLSARFHRTVVEMFAEAAEQVAARTGIQRVILAGGVFANQLVLEGMCRKLTRAGFEVLLPSLFPAGDGAISLGQAVVARNLVVSGRGKGG